MEKKSEITVLPKKRALDNFEDLMWFQYGNQEESDAAWERLQSSTPSKTGEKE